MILRQVAAGPPTDGPGFKGPGIIEFTQNLTYSPKLKYFTITYNLHLLLT